jgi:hypothetical protein
VLPPVSYKSSAPSLLSDVEKERVGAHEVVPMAALSDNGWCSE